jgi:hypothetical protein
LSTLNDVVVGCDHGPIGVGKPTCEAQLGDRYVTLAISLAVLAASAIAFRSSFAQDRTADCSRCLFAVQ